MLGIPNSSLAKRFIHAMLCSSLDLRNAVTIAPHMSVQAFHLHPKFLSSSIDFIPGSIRQVACKIRPGVVPIRYKGETQRAHKTCIKNAKKVMHPAFKQLFPSSDFQGNQWFTPILLQLIVACEIGPVVMQVRRKTYPIPVIYFLGIQIPFKAMTCEWLSRKMSVSILESVPAEYHKYSWKYKERSAHDIFYYFHTLPIRPHLLLSLSFHQCIAITWLLVGSSCNIRSYICKAGGVHS